jgi:glycosyltransferase involved in cell wall biosynthesis
VLVGSAGWLADDLLTRLESDPNLATVRHLGRVDDDVLVDLYSAAGLFAYPSLAEGFGLPILEAMACGAPVLTSRGGATQETAGEAARLVDPHSTQELTAALEELLNDPDARRALSRAGHERARTFSWASTAQSTLALYHRLAR